MELRGFCPDWEAIAQSIEQDVSEPERGAAWQYAARQWVEGIRHAFGPRYEVHETSRFLILTAASAGIARDVCQFCEWSLHCILQYLAGVAAEAGHGKHVVMMFEALDEYYDYIAHYYPEGSHPTSGGVYLDNGYGHFAVPVPDYFSYRNALAHELTHACLSHRSIPQWLNEAIAMRMEGALTDVYAFHFDRQLHQRHSAWWNANSIQSFWSGESWTVPGAGFELSYSLAQILWRKIEVDLRATREAVLQFIAGASIDDAGEESCRATFKRSLGDLVADFLGKGDWAPNPAAWPTRVAPRESASR
ncbi:MAG: hypothetical protein U1E05_15375 [Patescibacteria group bacterium]|nr:hypothetical protein [Patescibacteria group bacterium]